MRMPCQEGTRAAPSPFEGRAGDRGKAGLEMRRASTRVHQAHWLWPLGLMGKNTKRHSRGHSPHLP